VKILIAEDDALFRRALQHLLSAEFEIITAEDGRIASTLLQQEDHPTLALLDWVMPGLTGPELCRELRASPSTAGIYVILLTARNSAADILAGLRSGADDYVTKPFQAEELRARVRLGSRILEMQAALAAKSVVLEETLARERLLQIQLTSPSERNRWPGAGLPPSHALK
jgi:DNA-binding response OmpR family regulator